MTSPIASRLVFFNPSAGSAWSAERAMRAVELRALQRAKGLPPAELPDAGGGPSALDVVALIRAAESVEVLRVLWVEHDGESWLPFVRKVLDRRLVELGVAP